MAKEKAPAFQFYPRDLLSDINWMMMNYCEKGMYWHLISLCWLEGGIPSDLGAIARILQVDVCVVEDAWKQIGKCFQVHLNDCAILVHPRLELERQLQANHRKSCSVGGKHSAHKRKQKQQISEQQSTCISVPTETQLKGNSSSSSSSSNNKDNNTLSLVDVWNQTSEVRKVRKLDSKRSKTLRARLSESDWPWREAIAKFPLQCFRGNEWKPTLEWFIRPGTVNQILEGKYDFTPKGNNPIQRDTIGQSPDTDTDAPLSPAAIKKAQELFGGLE
jgi:hypothetical protein